MSRFNAFLHHTGERLALPKATRSQILVEIASDLEELFNHYLQQGMSEEEAAARAEEKVDMSDEALAELVRIHSDARGWTDRIVRRRQPFWEQIAMALIVLFFIVVATLGGETKAISHVTGFVWPVLLILLSVMAHFFFQIVRMSENPNTRRLRDGLATPLFLGAASVVVGFTGTGVVLYRTLKKMVANPDHAAPLFGSAAIGTTATLALSLIVALVAGISWFVLAGKIARIEDDAAERFMEVH